MLFVIKRIPLFANTMNTSDAFDPEETITVPPINFTVVIRPTTDGAVKAEIETWDPGEFNAMQHMMGIYNHRRFIGMIAAEQTPEAVFDLLLRVATACATRAAENTGTSWKKPLWLRALVWWRETKKRNSRQA
jgi:hypothetical protein